MKYTVITLQEIEIKTTVVEAADPYTAGMLGLYEATDPKAVQHIMKCLDIKDRATLTPKDYAFDAIYLCAVLEGTQTTIWTPGPEHLGF